MPYAHSANHSGIPHDLVEHLTSVAQQASQLAKSLVLPTSHTGLAYGMTWGSSILIFRPTLPTHQRDAGQIILAQERFWQKGVFLPSHFLLQDIMEVYQHSRN